MNAAELGVRLAQQAEEVCQHLLPSGKRKGHEWCAGGVGGEAGESLKVVVSGAKSGYWQDFADSSTMRGRSLLTLWREVKCPGDMATAIKQVKEYLGIRDESSYARPGEPPKWSAPEKGTAKTMGEKSPVMKYLTEKRGIGSDILKAYKVAESKDEQGYVFPYYYKNQLCMLKTVMVERDESGKKKSFVSKEALPTLFGKDTIKPSSDYVIITEGEIDAMSWHAAGHEAVSIPMGAQNDKWIEYDWDWLDQFERIYLSFDSDEAGQKAVLRVAERLGRERCYGVTLPGKDANEVWVSGEPNFEQFLESAKSFDPPEVERFFDNEDDIKRELWGKAETDLGIQLPWPLKLRVRRGENTIVTGFNNHGKSQVLLEMIVHLQDKGQRGFLASFEVDPPVAKSQMMQICAGPVNLDEKEYERLKQTVLSELIFYNHVGKCDWRKLLEIYRFCVKRYGVGFGIFDSFLLCGVSGDDYEEQDEFMREIQRTAKETKTHLFVVCHARKGGQSNAEDEPPSKQDVKGSGGLTDLAFNVMAVWRDIGRDGKIDEYTASGDTSKVLDLQNKPGARILLLKQKYGRGNERGALGQVYLHFDQSCGQYKLNKHDIPKRYFAPKPGNEIYVE